MAGSLLVFMLFWILLVKVNRSLNTADLDPSDQRVFWVSKFNTNWNESQIECIAIINFVVQIMALIVSVLGFLLALPFQILLRERPTKTLKKLEWYKWFMNPRFYLVSSNEPLRPVWFSIILIIIIFFITTT